MAINHNELTSKQAAFVNEFMIDLNGSQAAIRAGYSKKTARSIAAENLTKPAIIAALQTAMDERADRTEVSQDWVLLRLVENVERSMQAVQVLDRKGEPTGEYQYEGAVANRGLELIGKHIGMFVGPKGDDNAREVLEAFSELFSKRNEPGDGTVIDVPPNEQQPSTTTALAES